MLFLSRVLELNDLMKDAYLFRSYGHYRFCLYMVTRFCDSSPTIVLQGLTLPFRITMLQQIPVICACFVMSMELCVCIFCFSLPTINVTFAVDKVCVIINKLRMSAVLLVSPHNFKNITSCRWYCLGLLSFISLHSSNHVPDMVWIYFYPLICCCFR